MSRGFVKANPDRSILPNIDLFSGESKQILGYLYKYSNNIFLQSKYDKIEHSEKDSWPIRIIEIDIERIARHLNIIGESKIFPLVVRLDDQHELVTAPHWTTVPVSPAKHYGYAIQWFAMAIVLLLLYFYITLIDKHERTEKK